MVCIIDSPKVKIFIQTIYREIPGFFIPDKFHNLKHPFLAKQTINITTPLHRRGQIFFNFEVAAFPHNKQKAIPQGVVFYYAY
ncbi:hypothetical protein EG344_09205 [Chryseobacterium sp. G0162]|nr:hypothetical protein EG344_09205 [Chryseobacterium sp. G0162]